MPLMTSTNPNFDHEFFELLSSIIGTLIGLLVIIQLCQGHHSITAWTLRHYNEFLRIREILQNVTLDLPLHDIPDSRRTTYQPPEARPSSMHLRDGQEEMRGQQPSQSRDTNLGVPSRDSILIRGPPPNHEDKDLLEDFFQQSPSPDSISHTHGIADHARDSLDALQMARRS
ncbi:uncharacterized protein BT62DRAFT_1012125 [Guyanagaster necrorhizus]|uniref:Uncharacterized protein n=1 Tax=Guyanagaster necrorhizus TaxID=856835 RepID=A0A9P7VI12_9AGAR|nr:uncharacterized protein BT62DRAFT_1012125 [Guyanagaster necrorhizus MCA 3950]KAG7440907.1 hypothetical protein BT62DRAFT_1012125 [Guyanagaster necrorhizus MCA 3950]